MSKHYTMVQSIEKFLPGSLWTPFWVPPLLFLCLLGLFLVTGAKLAEWTSAIYFAPAMLGAHALTVTLLVLLLLDVRSVAAMLGALNRQWVESTIEKAQLIANPRYQKDAFDHGLGELMERTSRRWLVPVLVAVPITLIGLLTYLTAVRLPEATPVPRLLFVSSAEFLSVVITSVIASQWCWRAFAHAKLAVLQVIHEIYETGLLEKTRSAPAASARELVEQALEAGREKQRDLQTNNTHNPLDDLDLFGDGGSPYGDREEDPYGEG